MDNITYIREMERILEKRKSGVSVEVIAWELEKLEMNQDADRYAAYVKKYKEEMRMQQKPRREEISWKKWEDLMDKAEIMWAGEGGFEAVHIILTTANAMKDKIMAEEKKGKEAKQKLMDIITEKVNRGERVDVEFSNLSLLNEAERYRKKRAKVPITKKVVDSTFEETGKNIGRLVDTKNAKYGDSFSKSGGILRILYPDGIKLEQYDDVLTVCRILDKLFRVATDKDALGESPYTDIAGYCILALNHSKKETYEK